MSLTTRDAVTTHRSPSPTARFLYWGSRATLRHVYRAWPLTESGIRALGAVERGFARLPRSPEVAVESASLGGVPVVTTTPLPGTADSGVSVLYLHGGAFVFCGPDTHARLCSGLAVHLDAPVHAVRYRKLPEVDLGALIDDAYTAYRCLAGQLPETHRIVVAGDSAGGFLAAKICELAGLDGVRAPSAMVGYSPLFDLDREVRDGSWFTRDAFQPARTVQRAQQLWSRGPAGIRGERSMLQVSPEAFPPTLITLAAGELVEEGALALTERLNAAGRTVETHRWHTAVHAFPVLGRLSPESRRAREITVEFLQRVLA